ncbi:hypothetical protein Dimus_023345 [Dionaea muscipula]
MAAMALTHYLHSQNSSMKQHRSRNLISMIPSPLSCQNKKKIKPSNQTSTNPEKDKEMGSQRQRQRQRLLFDGIVKMGKDLKENLSPKKEGDWKDMVLMSFSFAVYVYMSQKIVCAYCAWMSTLK